MNKSILSLLLVGLTIIFTGCATTQLQTNTKMTRSIFLEPVAKSQRTVFVSVKNTSGQEIQLEKKLTKKLIAKGYRVVDDPNLAKYILMVNVLFANNLKEANAARAAGESSVLGTFAGASNNGGKGAIIGAIAGAVIGGVIGKSTEDDIFRMVVDVDIREKIDQQVNTTTGNTSGQATVSNQKRAGFKNSFAGDIRSKDQAGSLNDNMTNNTSQSYKTNYIEKQTRVFAEAVKNGLDLSKALPILADKVSTQIVGIF